MRNSTLFLIAVIFVVTGWRECVAQGDASFWTLQSGGSFTSENYGTYSGWSAVGVATGSDNKSHLLWDNIDGRTTIWNMTGPGTHNDEVYGPFVGWTARSIAVGGDGKTRLLWVHTGGKVVIWTFSAPGAYTDEVYGPFTGWTAKNIAVGADNKTRLLWTHTTGAVSLWTTSASGMYTTDNYGPYSSWTAMEVGVGADNKTRLLWSRTDGLVTIWTISSPGVHSDDTYGPFSGWTAYHIAVGQDNKTRLVWTFQTGAVSIWTITSPGSYATNNYGPFTGWRPVSVAVGADALTRILWNDEVVVYRNDFKNPVGAEWSKATIDTTPTGSRPFLGQFRNETVNLSLDNLPSHTTVTVSFDLFLIRVWHGSPQPYGPSIFDLYASGSQTLMHTTFCNEPFFNSGTQQAYPGTYPTDLYDSHTGAAEYQSLGYMYNGAGTLYARDSVYKITKTFFHSGNSLTLGFNGTNIDPGFDSSGNPNASWGFTNVQVRVNP